MKAHRPLSRGLALRLPLIVINNGRRGRVGDWDVIVAAKLAHAPGHRSAHRHPVEKFNPLRAGELNPIVHRIAGERVGLADDLVEAMRVELLIDVARAGAVELMRQPAGADDHHA